MTKIKTMTTIDSATREVVVVTTFLAPERRNHRVGRHPRRPLHEKRRAAVSCWWCWTNMALVPLFLASPVASWTLSWWNVRHPGCRYHSHHGWVSMTTIMTMMKKEDGQQLPLEETEASSALIQAGNNITLAASSAISSSPQEMVEVPRRPLSVQVEYHHRRRQVRRKPQNRRPRHYWTHLDHMERELREFWQTCGIDYTTFPGRTPTFPLHRDGEDDQIHASSLKTSTTTSKSTQIEPSLNHTVAVAEIDVIRVPIPNERLLLQYGRHDLRAAIETWGGRQLLSERLGGAPIVPGRWLRAVQVWPQLDSALAPVDGTWPCKVEYSEYHGLDAFHLKCDDEVLLGQQCNQTDQNPGGQHHDQVRKWSHHQGRKPKGYWSLHAVIQELYEYVDDIRDRKGRPSVWMPRLSELGSAGRDDLRQAIQRYGGAAKVGRLAGMVPYREWHYMEGQYELLTELQRYLDEHHAGSNYQIFPRVQDVKRHGYDQLHTLIMYYGGRKIVAARLGFLQPPAGPSSTSRREAADVADLTLNWGPFDLVLAIQLLRLVREDHVRRQPPLRDPVLAMPTRSKLVLLVGTEAAQALDQQIHKFGGYENVGRRLGLAI